MRNWEYLDKNAIKLGVIKRNGYIRWTVVKKPIKDVVENTPKWFEHSKKF